MQVPVTEQERESFESLRRSGAGDGFVDTWTAIYGRHNNAFTWFGKFPARARNGGRRIDFVLCSSSLRASLIGASILDQVPLRVPPIRQLSAFADAAHC